jgi:hypothetical protein
VAKELRKEGYYARVIEYKDGDYSVYRKKKELKSQ